MNNKPYYECGKGWHSIIEVALGDLYEHDPGIEILQIKEKFGGLRIYVYPNDDRTQEIIQKAKDLCAQTCEVCGEMGALDSDRGWWKTLCEEHKV